MPVARSRCAPSRSFAGQLLTTCCAVLVGGAVACGDGGAFNPNQSSASGTIAYIGDYRAQRDLWVMDADGSNHRNLTRDQDGDPMSAPVGERDPEFSPDGSRIVYVDYTGATGDQLALMNADGTGRQLLTNDTAHPSAPSWSPDGLHLAFAGRNGIEVMDLNGAERRSIGPGVSPDWSPDGARLAITTSSPNAFPGIFVLNSDGSNRIRISPDTAYDGDPAWSPDGTMIAFTNRLWVWGRTDFIYSIGVMNPDGSNRRRLIVDSTHVHAFPAWSPDGRSIVFMSSRDGTEQLYRINADGTNLVQLTRVLERYRGNRSQPSWTSRVP